MALQCTVTSDDLIGKHPELDAATTPAKLTAYIAQAFDGFKDELRMKYAERLYREHAISEMDFAKVPDDANPFYKPIIVEMALCITFDNLSTSANSGSHAFQRDKHGAKAEELMRRIPLYYDFDGSGEAEASEISDTGTVAIR